MTANPVDCQRTVHESLAEQYVAGGLEGDLRDAFELHYMGCAACFDRVAVLHTVRDRLAVGPAAGSPTVARATGWSARGVWWTAVGIAASVTIAVWVLPPTRPAPAGGQGAPTPVSAATSAPVDPLVALAVFEPPAYRASVLRGREDDLAAQFRTAMALYQQGRFADAVPGLTRAAAGREDAAFFLAACWMLVGDAARAADAARQAVAFGDTSYREDARLLLAKALLRLHDREGAVRELERVKAMGGERRVEASNLLARLNALP